MKKALLILSGALALALGFSTGSTAEACGKDGHCDCAKAHGAGPGVKAETVALEGTVQNYGCNMKAAKMECTGAALVVGDKIHLIKRADKGPELVKKAKGTKKVVTVKGTEQGEFLTVAEYTIKG